MKPVKCESCKKYYDEDKYDVCPHCNAESSAILVQSESSIELDDSVEQSTNTRKGLFSKRNKGLFSKRSNDADNNLKHDINDAYSDVYSSSVNDFFAIGQTAGEEKVHIEPVKQIICDEPVAENTYDKPIKENVCNEPVFERDYDELTVENAIEEPVQEENAPVNSLAEAIKQADSVNSTTDLKTVAYYNFSNDIEPVVGWLVCIKGEYKGESFGLKSGRNNIGRALTMDVALAQEKTVSRERHASITFDPQQKQFFVQSGESRGLTYINKELLMTFKELKKGDVITLGSCELLFYPLCGEDFSWDDYE